jgi:hypothetical protein
MDIIQGLIETESIGRPMWRIVNNNGTFEILNNMSSNVIFSILNGGNIEVDTDVYNVITNYTEGNGGTSSQWTTSGVEIYYNSGNIGIGTNDPITPLHIYNTSNTRLLLDTTTTSSASIEFRRGIGTDILTDFRFINDTNGYIKLQYENNTQTYSDTIANLAWFSSNETIIHKNTAINGRVGIGTTYHTTRSLDVVGDANISGLMTTSNLSVLGSATITNSIINEISLTIQNSLSSSSSSSINFVRGTTTDTNHDYKIGNYNGEFKVISSVSSVDTDYIKITSSGAISNPAGTASWNTGSDRRIKENIERASYDKCYDNINRLELNRFSYIEGFNTVNKDNKQLGFIAQEVYDVFPKSISSQGYYSDALNIPDLLSIDVSQINYTLYGAVKKLIEINDGDEALMKNYEERLKNIETILNIPLEPATSNLFVDA